MVQRSLEGKRAVVHARESKLEARAGNRSTAEQVEESREWCDSEGIEVAHVIVEDGVGASPLSKGARAGKKRNDWEYTKQLLVNGDDAGPIDILVTWSSTRSQRDLDEYVKLRRICVEAEVLWCYGGRVYNMADGDDRFRTAIDGAVGERDSYEIHKNVMRGIRSNIKNGKPHGRLLYGYRRIYDEETKAFVRQEPHPDQAWVVQWIFKAYLKGHSVNKATRCLQTVSVLSLALLGWSVLPTQRGAPWSAGYVRKILRNPAYIGRRLHNGDDVGDAVWPAIIDPKVFHRVQQRLDAKSSKPTRSAPRRRLLSGVVVCSVCGQRLTYNPPWRNRSANYYCRHNGHVARSAKKLEDYVTAWVLERFRRPDATDLFADDDDPATEEARQQINEWKTDLEGAMQLWRQGKLTAASYAQMEQDRLAMIAEAERTIRRAAIPISVDVPPVQRLETWWFDELTDEQRREVVVALIAAVVVRPLGNRRRNYDLTEVTEIEWRR